MAVTPLLGLVKPARSDVDYEGPFATSMDVLDAVPGKPAGPNAGGLTGATQTVRFAGGTSSGAPVSGTFAVGDYVIARDGNLWICTVAGSPGTWVNPVGDLQSTVATLQSSVDALASHGPSSHADLARYFFASAGAGAVADSSHLVLLSSGPAYSMPDAATDTVTFDFPVPGDFVSSMAYEIMWVPSATATGAVRWNHQILAGVAGADMSAAGTGLGWTGSGAAKTLNQLVVEASQAFPGAQALAPGTLVRFQLQRLGSAGTDTYTGTAHLVGVRFSYTANG